ncbi:flippase [Aquimarina sp. BL5]|uniref:flippase n=1 Tax=Aquimarina sp. BL5 TaxID=1714860 RepID=UPI000E556098|nr:flippase [Aquimarina sp. BL5]AXT51977.1 flippase [Aquimarina sp. BL5]RKN03246.1 flippase [Aquimarina sp. BL5]
MTKSKIDKSKVFNLIWGVLGKLFSGVKLALLGIIIARYLGPEDFGVISYVVSFVSLLSVLAEFRLQSILIREFSTKESSPNELLGTSFRICFFFATVGYLILSIVVLNIKDDFNVKLYILIYGISYFFQAIRFLRAYFIAGFSNKMIIKAEVATTVIVLITGLLLIYGEATIIYFVVLRTIDFFVFSLLLILLYKSQRKSVSSWKYNKELRIKLVKDSLPLVLSGFAIIVFQRVDQIMLRLFIDDYAVGQYSAAVSITSIISFVPIILSESIVPTLIKKKENNFEAYKKFRQRFSDYMTWGSLFLSTFILVLSPIIIKILYGDDYLPAIEVMKIFSFKGALVAMGAVAGQIMIIENIHQIAYIKSIVGGIANIVLNFVLIVELGMIGAVWASIAAFFLSSYFVHLFMKRYRYLFWIQTKSLVFGLYYIFVDSREILRKELYQK